MELSKKDLAIIELYNKGYRVSKLGEILNPSQKIIKGNFQKLKGVNYRGLNLRKGSSHITIVVHRLQAYQKFGEKIFEKGIEVRHLNSNSLDNSYDNIGIGTSSDNSLDKPKHVRQNAAITASRSFQNTLRTYEDRCKIYDELIKGTPYSQIKLNHKVEHSSTLSFMKNKSLEFEEYKKTKVK